ncbi:MAG TPA: efflux RND transporter periplasmic adaptor subunit [Anaeromyxobacter sp.]
MTRSLAVPAAALLAAACGGDRGRPPAPAPAPAAAAPAQPATSRLVAPERVRHASRIATTGTLKARQSAPLAMSAAGTLLRVAVKRGQEVREGALLASLDDAAAAAGRRQAEAAVAAARAQLALAEDALARVKRIRDEEGVSEAQLVEARSRRDLAVAGLAGAEAQLEQAKVLLAHHHLHAPFAGVVTRVPDGVGITVAPGVPVVSLASTRQLVLETSLTQAEAAEVRRGAKVVVTVPATGAHTAEATVEVVVPSVDTETNRVPVEIAVPNADGRFLANAFARAEVSGRVERDAWRIPAAALVQRSGGYAVWVTGPDAKARTLPVRLLAEARDLAVVAPDEGGWPDGLRVVEAPPLGISEGALLAEAGR